MISSEAIYKALDITIVSILILFLWPIMLFNRLKDWWKMNEIGCKLTKNAYFEWFCAFIAFLLIPVFFVMFVYDIWKERKENEP